MLWICQNFIKILVRIIQLQNYKIKNNIENYSLCVCLTDLVDDYCCALFRPSILMAVLDIVGEHIPTLEVLNLESNKLLNINKLSELNKKFSKLKILHIGDNKVSVYKLYIIYIVSSILSYIFTYADKRHLSDRCY